jgi:pseudaminic acid biosynthesis-associated methylase
VSDEATRLESLWSGEFGDDYTERNAAAGDLRGPFWTSLVEQHAITNVLEVGCNVGANLRWLAELLPVGHAFGIDVNEHALERLRQTIPTINAVWSSGRDLPFRDRWFDLTFTAGVLIHQADDALQLVMSEVVRCSGRYVLCMEYYGATTQEVPYRGHRGALFRRDYGSIYRRLFPELELVDEGRLGADEGFDDVTWWLFERPAAG